jgi:hypothetical protein
MARIKGERFAKLPIELLEHPTVTTLPHAAFRVLAIFAAGDSYKAQPAEDASGRSDQLYFV